MKLYLAQLNTTVGAIADNAALVSAELARARAARAELAIFPELTLTGYPPQDLLEFPAFIQRNLDELEQLAPQTDDELGAIVGFVGRSDSTQGAGLHNSAALLGGGRILSVHHKTLLPTYDVFDEARWFEPAQSVAPAQWRGRRIGIAICEDFWFNEFIGKRARYKDDPLLKLASLKPDLLVGISASPYTLGKRAVRRRIFSGIARRCGIPLAQVNLVGGNDSLIFDGGSNVYSATGEVIAQAADFRADGLCVDLERAAGPFHPTCREDLEEVHQALTLGIRDYVHKCGFSKTVIGLSGGIDSALTAALAAAALGPENVVGVSMPSRYSSDHSQDDARRLAANLGIELLRIPIEKTFSAVLEELAPVFAGREPDVTEENLQARCRGLTLMALSNKFGWLVLSTGNKSENAAGYATLYGDMCGGLAVISDLPKTLVYRLARWINRAGEIIPQNSLDKPPSAELRPEQKDSDSLPEYDLLDPIVEAYVENCQSAEEIIAAGHDPATVRRVLRMINQNEYKRRQAAPGLKITSKAFGFGRRMPIAAKF